VNEGTPREGDLLTRERRRVAVLRRTWTRHRTNLDHSGVEEVERWGWGCMALTLLCQF